MFKESKIQCHLCSISNLLAIEERDLLLTTVLLQRRKLRLARGVHRLGNGRVIIYGLCCFRYVSQCARFAHSTCKGSGNRAIPETLTAFQCYIFSYGLPIAPAQIADRAVSITELEVQVADVAKKADTAESLRCDIA